MKEAVKHLTDAMLNLPQVEIEMQHHVMNGMYARTCKIPAGVVITGCTHKTDHISIIHGHARLTIGDSVEELEGYNVLPTNKGMTRAIYAISEVYFTAICKTDKTELADIEDDLVEEAAMLQTRNPAMSVNKQILIGA